MFLSIITINRNNALGLKKTIESVSIQTCRDFEHIIIDGASTDCSVDVIRQYVESDFGKNVSYWVSEPDTGIYNAMNKGILHAKGDFILMLNSGDALCEDVLKVIKKKISENVDAVYYGVVNDVKDGKFIQVEGLCSGDLKKGMISHQASFVPRKFHGIYGLYNENYKIKADYDFFLNLYFAGIKFVYLNLIVSDFDKSGCSCMDMNVFKEDKKIRKKYNIYTPTLKERIYNFLLPIWYRMK